MVAIKRAIAIIYTVAAIAALGIGFMGLPRDPLNFVFAIVLGMPWTLLAGYVASDVTWFGPVIIIGSLALNAGLLLSTNCSLEPVLVPPERRIISGFRDGPF
jgi:hypothetical protein